MSEPSYSDFCLDFESDHDRRPSAIDVWRELQQELSASQAREAELREREMVLVKGLNALNYTASENSPNACIVRELLRRLEI